MVQARPTQNVVVILGAGSSADFGVPTLRSIFKNTEAATCLRRDKILHDWLQKTFWEPRGHTVASSDQSVTVEEMLTILRDWQREPSVESPATAELEDIRRRLYILIYEAVYENKGSRKEHLNGLINTLQASFARVTWASFNWDCLFEASFYYNSAPPFVGSRYNPTLGIKLKGWRDGTVRHEYLKLHGSVNWWRIGGTPSYLSFGSYGELSKKWKELAEAKTEDRPIILEPSAYKYEDALYKQLLEPQWNKFLVRLCEADAVLIVGYSLPENDLEARCKIVTAFQVNEKCQWAVVDHARETRDKYQRLLGMKRLVTFEASLAGFGVALVDNLRQAFPRLEIVDPKAPVIKPAIDV